MYCAGMVVSWIMKMGTQLAQLTAATKNRCWKCSTYVNIMLQSACLNIESEMLGISNEFYEFAE